MFALSIIVATGYRADGCPLHPAERERATARADAYAADMFGGFTRHDTTGAGRDAYGRIVHEPGLCYLILIPEFGEAEQAKARELAQLLRRAFQQNAVLLTAAPVAAELIESPTTQSETKAAA